MNYRNIIQLLKEFDYDRNSKDSLIDFLSLMLHYLDEIPTPLFTAENCTIEEIKE